MNQSVDKLEQLGKYNVIISYGSEASLRMLCLQFYEAI